MKFLLTILADAKTKKTAPCSRLVLSIGSKADEDEHAQKEDYFASHHLDKTFNNRDQCYPEVKVYHTEDNHNIRYSDFFQVFFKNFFAQDGPAIKYFLYVRRYGVKGCI